MRRWCGAVLFPALALCPPLAAAAGGVLTFAEALAAVEAPHPDVLVAEARREAALAGKSLAEAGDDLRVNLEIVVAGGNPTLGGGDFTSDHSARLNVRKTLHDFGRTRAAVDAAGLELSARDLQLLDARAQRRLTIMARYFDVLTADLAATVETERTAVAYTQWDHQRDRAAVGTASPSRLLEADSRFQDARALRNAAVVAQRTTRVRLANALARTGDPLAELEDPKLAANDAPLPEIEALETVMVKSNPQLLALDQRMAASRRRLALLRAADHPVLDAEAEAAAFSREAVTRDSLRAGLVFSWPVFSGNRTDSRLAQEHANFRELEASRLRLGIDLDEALAETVLQIEDLRSSGRQSAARFAEYRDAALERARAEYELERITTLGTNMAETMQATLRARHVEYRIALALARLEALLGAPLSSVPSGEKK